MMAMLTDDLAAKLRRVPGSHPRQRATLPLLVSLFLAVLLVSGTTLQAH